MQWRKLSSNEVLDGEDFLISYNLRPWQGVSFFKSDTGGAETALVKDNVFLILNGDYRKQYEELVPKGFEACKAFFDSQPVENVSSWTTPNLSKGN